MVEIEFIKQTEVYKIGDVVKVSDSEAKEIINEGFAKYKNEPIETINPKLDLSDIVPDSSNGSQPYNPGGQVDPKDTIKILDLFSPHEITLAGGGTYKMECPSCGLQGNRTEGFILFPDSNTAYCQSSHNWFRMLEVYALKKKLIKCLDGREKGDTKKKVLEGELWTLTLEEFKEEYGVEKYNELCKQMGIKKRVEIPGNNRTVSDFIDDMAEIYKSRNILFKRAETGDIIRIDRNNIIKETGEVIVEKGLKIVEPEVFVSLAEMLIIPWTTIFTKNGSMIVIKSMTSSHANLALKSDAFKNKCPTLHRNLDIQIPVIYNKKLTFPKKGYDKRFGTWLPFTAPQIKTDMYTLEEAKGLIEYIFREFCFETETDKLHAIAAFITPFCRGLFTGDDKFSTRTPVFIYMANRERAGKDYCANCSGILYEGSAVEMPPICNDEKGSTNNNEETRKKLTACMVEGKKRFHSSNNKGLLNNAAFESATTTKIWTDRVLGKTKTVTYNNEMDYSLSGNLGITLTPDMANRGRIIRLLLVEEDANGRKFENPNLHEWILERRFFIISAMYTLVKNWVEKGMPSGSVPFTSFPEWARVVGGILEAAGYDSPCRKVEDTGLIALDADTEEMKLLYQTCYNKYPNQWIDKEQIEIEAQSIMTSLDFSKRSDQTSFGTKLDKFVKRELSGITLKVDSMQKRGSRRKYIFYKNPLAESLSEKTPNLTENPEKVATWQPVATYPLSPHIAYKGLYSDSGEVARGSQVTKIEQNNISTTSSKDNIDVKKESPQEPNNNIPVAKIMTSQEIDKIGKAYLRKEMESSKTISKPKERTERELQFWEDPQCAGITAQCTKEQTLQWVKDNPKATYKDMRMALGLGCSRWLVELNKERLIQRTDIGWEPLNG